MEIVAPPTVPPTSQGYAVATGTAGAVAEPFSGRLAAPFFTAFREFTGAFFAAVFLAAVFLAAGACWALAAVAASAFTLAHRLRAGCPESL